MNWEIEFRDAADTTIATTEYGDAHAADFVADRIRGELKQYFTPAVTYALVRHAGYEIEFRIDR